MHSEQYAILLMVLKHLSRVVHIESLLENVISAY